MGFRYRKSFNLGGGFRVNLSKSGIGYSWGTKGYRVTKTSNGTTRHTISIPGTGISYVEEHKNRNNAPASHEQTVVNPHSNYHDVEAVVSADASTLKSDTYKELFSQIKKIKFLVYTLVVCAFFLSGTNIPLLFYSMIAVALFVSRKWRPSIEYTFDDYQQKRWSEISEAWAQVAMSKDLQEITLNAKSNDPRKNAGIKHSVESRPMTAGFKLPWYVKTNVKPVVFKLRRFKIAIMPDRLLIFNRKMGALDYKEVRFDLSAIGFLVEGKLPSDSELIQYVWGYSNKDGSRDKRFKKNKQYPIMKYGKIIITSKSGLNIQFMVSNEAAADKLHEILKKYKM